ncbi:MAG: G5 domain-containing protein [Clostridiales bacterium]|nr:G5 domain-containing protein [Clostridiales bacterium]
METMEMYAQHRLDTLKRRREQKRRQKIRHRVCAVITLIAVCTASAGTIYTVSAKDITITEINEFEGTANSIMVRTRASEVIDVLNEQGIEVTDTDKLNVPSDAKPDDNSEIVLRRGKEIKVVTSNNEETVVVTSADTDQALREAGYITSDTDEITLDGGSIASSDTVEIKSISITYESEEEEIPFETIYQDDSASYKGTETVVTDGANGIKLKTYKVLTYDNGEQKERTLESETIVSEPTSKVVKRGTKDKPAPTDSGSSSAAAPAQDTGSTIAGHRYSKKIIMQGTAYTDSPAENGGYSCTALGTALRKGVVAVDPSVIPLRSKLYIVSADGKYVYGEASAEDTGGAIKGNRIDLCYPSYSDCTNFGRRDVIVYILSD